MKIKSLLPAADAESDETWEAAAWMFSALLFANKKKLQINKYVINIK